ncbi:glycine betaine ABC transporter substrate-binding protein [Shouchella clausii]|uniref:glycine betaine ABC transporter substrate-binding protein n=1 Tax=Shouchella TaxID=2893057 RepID=UPI0004E6B21F|nr:MULTISPECIES: glycine betaine ABC transporter substrate-binding protein [Shouchella]ALA53683.1 Glycine betaine ABC transport system, glycine betaine-binding protein OpuAC [Shouchella clausii]MBU3229746.1 glycine betaine ABC transporter substrate-binding protein [Shouchella clausii]MBU3264170.1 glycine betaine ABC transporter substrate-binding protein [Shouchella clausii]MBU3506647.1 glycine betaine ABC transporter substrate-binding protein [Shouchella clausii]MBU3536168.1 glycine betaine AB
MNKITSITGILLAALTLGGCASNEQTITIGHNNYAESIAFAHLWKTLLEDQGYQVELSLVEKAMLFNGVENGDIDIGFNTWLPFTDQAYVSLDSEEIDVQADGVLYEGTTLGLAVPSYMDNVETIGDLAGYFDELKGTITGIDPGSALMQLTQDEVIDHYGLEEFTLQSSSEQAMIAELDARYKNEEPIVVTLWSPHWTFGSYDLKFLDDPDHVYGEEDDIYYMARNGLAEDEPDLIQWLNNCHFTEETLSELLTLQQQYEDDIDGAVAEWIEKHEDLVHAWLEG